MTPATSGKTPQANSAQTINTGAQRRLRILLIDDEELIRVYFRDVFWIHGLEERYELNLAGSIAQAEEALTNPTTRPDVVFLDLSLPIEIKGEMTISPAGGFYLLQKIKSTPEWHAIKVIMFTGHSETEFRTEAEKAGADGYLVKGENLPQDLIQYVDKLFSNAQRQ